MEISSIVNVPFYNLSNKAMLNYSIGSSLIVSLAVTALVGFALYLKESYGNAEDLQEKNKITAIYELNNQEDNFEVIENSDTFFFNEENELP